MARTPVVDGPPGRALMVSGLEVGRVGATRASRLSGVVSGWGEALGP
ncbi:hypothetical protein [Varunaivibrio sulfuroxidans]|nr:hypothetical protein [Varunaivibrio sulfuroxidans]WES32125.1 hypothetical protein P3M64_07140 [Varunaivibrio sulfuroxidans]